MPKKVKIEDLTNIFKAELVKTINEDVEEIGKSVISKSPLIYKTNLGVFKGTESNPVIYPSGEINVVGDYKNSWWVVSSFEDEVSGRDPDPTGFDSIEEVNSFKRDNDELKNIVITNGVHYSNKVEENHKVVGNSKKIVIPYLRGKYKVK